MPAKLFIAALLAFAAAAIAFGPASAETGPALIRIAAADANIALIDNGRRGRGIGDVEMISQRLFNRRITLRPIGRAHTECTLSFNQMRLCRTTYTLPRGKIVASGSLRYRQIYELAIVGGTGLYNNARGTLTVTQTRARPRREFLVFRLAG